ncbi:MAG: hypothetical protein WBM43_13595 [Flavobacteriaceae bacterium]
MLKRNSWILIIVSGLLMLNCTEEENTYFLIASDQVGLLDRQTIMAEVADIYKADSLVSDSIQVSFGEVGRKLKVFEKGGKHLLTLTSNSDSIAGIGHILVADTRYKTEKGIGLQSTFTDIDKNYSIDKIITSMNNIVVLLKDSDIYFTIDKKELPAHLRYTKNRPIEKVEIPGQAAIKYLMVGWE